MSIFELFMRMDPKMMEPFRNSNNSISKIPEVTMEELEDQLKFMKDAKSADDSKVIEELLKHVGDSPSLSNMLFWNFTTTS